MDFQTQLEHYISAGFSGLWLHTYEPEATISEIAQLCHRMKEGGETWRLCSWDADRKFRVLGTAGGVASSSANTIVDGIKVGMQQRIEPPGRALVALYNLHRFTQSAEVVQTLANHIEKGKREGVHYLVLSPSLTIAIELEKLVTVLEYALPSKEQLAQIWDSLDDAVDPKCRSEHALHRPRALDAAAGLTRSAAENAFAMAIARRRWIDPMLVWEVKARELHKGGALQLYSGQENFQSLGGLENLKDFCLRALTRRTSKAKAKGVLLLGVPGTGKSMFAKALGNETGRKTISLDVGALFGSLQGQTEERTRAALAQADAMEPVVLYIDEIEKALGGAFQSTGQTDSGVGARLGGSFLTWLNDRTSDVFLVLTANDITKLPPEFTRSERFDAVFFLDLPLREQRSRIWEIYEKVYEVAGERPDDQNWTGAEIAACCRMAALLGTDLKTAAQNVVPISRTAGEKVEALRNWADGRCVATEYPGRYDKSKADALLEDAQAQSRRIRSHEGL